MSVRNSVKGKYNPENVYGIEKQSKVLTCRTKKTVRDMPQVELIMPKMGESIMEATILKWLKQPGDKIEQDESVLEVATDKVDTEVPSTHAGILKEILAKEGEVVKIGKPIAIVTADTEPVKETGTQQVNGQASVAAAEPVDVPAEVEPQESFRNTNRFYSPLVKNIAREENISVAELETIQGSGAEGRVTKKDILDFVQVRKSGGGIKESRPVQSGAPAVQMSPKVHVSVSAGDEIIEMDRMRKMIAERMVESKRIAPHVTSFVEADVTNVVQWRNKVKGEFQKREGDVLTFTPVFIEAVVQAIRDFPMINIQVDGDRIIRKRDINIGMAVALPNGNLIVPVIRNADQYTINGLAKIVNDLARRARDNKLKPDDLTGGTFTVSNVGSFGNVMGTPIIMQPQVGIIALGAIQKKPAVMEMPYGDVIAIRHKMFLSHSYDHRVVDGSLGGSVVRRVADYLERFDINRTI
jgi:2-oxoglutarate dehydrogenase E2 component (dihydrolipoamide succinyltransferase)